MKKRMKTKLLSLSLCLCVGATTLFSDMSLTALAAENDSATGFSGSLVASFDFDSEETGFKGSGAITTNNGVTLVDSALGKAASFNGSSYLEVMKEDGSSLLTDATEITISYLRECAAAGNTGWSFFAAPDANEQKYKTEHYAGLLDQNGSITVERYNNTDGRPGSLNSSGSFSGWQLVTVVMNETNTSLYVNGALMTSRADEYRLTDILGNNSILYIGRANWGSGGEYFKGTIDNFEIYNKALDAGEVSSLYEAYLEKLKAAEDEKTEEEETPADPAELLKEDCDALTIPNSDDIRGNITLPLKGKNGSDITWTSSNEAVITANAKENVGYAPTPAGVVTRQDSDTGVKLTASLTDGTNTLTKDFEVTVKAKTAKADTTDYLFAYFTGDTLAGERICFAASQDGLSFSEINEGAPVITSKLGTKGLRDPFIMRSAEGDKFYLLATDLSIGSGTSWGAAQNAGSQAIMVWESSDLVNWSDQRMVTISSGINAGCTWAPEAYYDEITGEYVVFWASKVAKDNYSLQRVYYCKTRDFVTFTEPEVWIDRETASTIDTTIIKGQDGNLYRILKNEGDATLPDGTKIKGATVYIERSMSMFGEWTRVNSESIENVAGVEGPTAYRLNSDDAAEDTICILLDHYGNGGYKPYLTTTLDAGEAETRVALASNFSLPSSPRHGTVLNITAEEYANVMKAYGEKEVEDVEDVLVAEYKFDELSLENTEDGSEVADASGNAKAAVIKGKGAKTSDGYLYLPGGGASSNAAYVELPGEIFKDQDTLTISIWLQNETGAGNYAGMFFGKATKNYGNGTGSNPASYWLLNPCNPSGYFKSVFTEGSNASSPWSLETATSSTATDNGWNLYTTVITPNSIIGYYNGRQVSKSAKSYKTSDMGDVVAAIGRSGYADKFYEGGVYDLKVYSTRLTDKEIADEYTRGNRILNGESDVAFSTTIKLDPEKSTRFNDTNNDGFGEFEGWGTSLCWWANRLGYSNKLVAEAAEKFFSSKGLNLNIGRYNVGGGDLVSTEITSTEDAGICANENADCYDLVTEGKKPTYGGSNMSINSVNFSGSKYKVTDADFGIIKDKKSKSFKYIGYINGMEGALGSGDKLNYTVNAAESGDYTIKCLLTLSGNNDRDLCVRVGGKDYICDHTNFIVAAESSNQKLYIATINNVKLEKGNNTLLIAGKGTAWMLDFIEMLVIPAGKEATEVKDTDDSAEEKEQSFLHASHITRSDSTVPGYCVDVTKMDLKNKTLSYYEENFDRADATSGYAWNYDWNADNRQVAILVAAAAASGDDFITEAFSNSPPYFMTESGCSSGNIDAGTDNLREDCVTAFACYMADVIEHLNNEDNGITVQSATGMNEPYTEYWGAFSPKQEGCHFDLGESQSRVIVALNKELKKKGIDLVYSASDETSIDTAISSYKALSEEAKEIVTRIDTHTYSGSKREELSDLAYESNENLWMSEIDGAFNDNKDAGEMNCALGFANRIIKDVDGLDCTAWIMWNAVDMNVDANNKFDSNSIAELGYNPEGGYWGIAIGDHNNETIVLTKKYYAFGQFSRYIRPGMTIIGSTGNTLSAYDPATGQVVVVVVNTAATDKIAKLSLSKFNAMSSDIKAIRTSGSIADGENWADVTDEDIVAVDAKEKCFYATLKAHSITTYIVGQTKYDPSSKEDDDEDKNDDPQKENCVKSLSEVSEFVITADMITGSEPWGVSTTNTVKKIVDSNVSSFFDGVGDGYALIDLGKAIDIKAIGFCPRDGYEDRMKGGLFYGSNDGVNFTLLYEVPRTPSKNTITTVFEGDFEARGAYRYIKYTAADGECANIAEIKLYTTPETNKTSYTTISGVNGAKIYATNGKEIQAHGGQIQQLTVNGVTKYYWIGEDKTDDYRPCPGIHMYSSTNLMNWDDEGVVLKTMSSKEDFNTDYFSALYGKYDAANGLTDYQKAVYNDLWQGGSDKGCVIERPKMLYNEKTNKYIVYFHADGTTPESVDGSNYGKAKLGVAISDNVNGPYKLLGTYIMHEDTGYDSNWDDCNGHVRDMNVFKDDDGTAYVMFSSDGNVDMYIAKLNDDYTGIVKSGTDENGNPKGIKGVDYTVAFTSSREAPAMFKKNGIYFLVTSGCTGWDPNPASYAYATNILGPWTAVANPCTDSEANTTYRTQSTCVVKLENGGYMYMGDRWNSSILRDSRYVWLPIEFTSETGIKIAAYKDWDMSVFDGIRSFGVVTELPKKASSLAELKEKLPSTIDIMFEGAAASTSVDVEWSVTENMYSIGDVTVKGILSNGREFSFICNIINEKLIYFFDCAASDAEVEANDGVFEAIAAKVGKQLRNTEHDQAYTEENGAGYTGSLTDDIGVKNAGDTIYAHGFWARSNKNIDYAFKLEAGEYAADLGFCEWWNTTRYMNISVKVADQTIATKSFTCSSSATSEQQSVEFTLEEPALVTISVSKTSGNDPVLSWIALIKNDLVIEKEEDKDDDQEEENKPSKPVKPVKPSVQPGQASGSAIQPTGQALQPVNIVEQAKKPSKTATKNVSEEETEEEIPEVPTIEENEAANEEVAPDKEETEVTAIEDPKTAEAGGDQVNEKSFPVVPVVGGILVLLLLAAAVLTATRRKKN